MSDTATLARPDGATSIDPATGAEIGFYPHHDGEAVEAIVAAAAAAQREWAGRGVAERARFLGRLGDELRRRAEPMARLITAEMGKPITAARAEVKKCVDLCDWYAARAEALLADEVADVGGDGAAVIRYLPLGVVLAVMPWNFPIWQALRAAVPILAGGNGFLLKHADNVQGCAAALAEAFAAAGAPAGLFAVLNVGHEVLPGLIADDRIAAVTVTAGRQAGASVASEAARHWKKSVLELGGSDPFIVLADADLDRAVACAVTARYQNAGQVCIAAKRLIVEAPVLEEFTRRFVAASAGLSQGDPAQDTTEMGPMARVRLRTEVHAQVEKSLAMGARLLLGGVIPEGPGAWYPPTVLADVTPGMPAFDEETFGPVAAIIAADDAEHALRLANDSRYGLSGAIWSADTARAEALARRIVTGGVFVNGMSVSDPRVPIGGVRESGYGRELSHFGIREFCNAQLVWARG